MDSSQTRLIHKVDCINVFSNNNMLMLRNLAILQRTKSVVITTATSKCISGEEDSVRVCFSFALLRLHFNPLATC